MSSIEPTLYEKLNTRLSPQLLVITNDSQRHAGHREVKNDHSGETHFTIRIISPFFSGMPRIQRHQAVYETLANEMDNPIHALSLELFSPEEVTGQTNNS